MNGPASKEPTMTIAEYITCPRCYGLGLVGDRICPSCGGGGLVLPAVR